MRANAPRGGREAMCRTINLRVLLTSVEGTCSRNRNN